MCSSRPDDDPSQYDQPEWTPAQIDEAIVEAIEHGHPLFSHAVAAGPCTKPSKFSYWPRDDEGRLFHRHLFWQDEILPRKEGECDYTFDNGDYCGKLPGHAIHDLAETPS